MLAVGLLYLAFIMLLYIPFIPTLLSFYHKWMLNFVKNNLILIDAEKSFIFLLLMWYIIMIYEC